MEPIGGVGMQGTLLAQLQPPPALPGVDAIDATRFAEMVQPAALSPEATKAGVTAAAGAATPGDSILEGMKTLGADFRETWGNMKVALSQPTETMTLADMLRLQMQMMQLSVQVELVGKTISKATQNVDQLSKLQ